MSGSSGHQWMLRLYTWAGWLALPILRCRRRHFRDAAMTRERRGELELPPAVRAAPRRYWLHGASVGELMALPPIVAELRRRDPEAAIVVSALTDTGLDTAHELEGIDAAFALPLDLPRPMDLALASLRPTVLFLLETELWPRLLTACRSHAVPVMVLNGKLSARGARAYRRLGLLFRPLLSGLVGVAAQSQLDAARFVRLGVPERDVVATGSSKIDTLPDGPPPVRAALVHGRAVVVAGSIRAGEEPIVLDAWRKLSGIVRQLDREPTVNAAAARSKQTAPLLVLGPRHLQHLAAVEQQIRRCGLTACRRSAMHAELTTAVAEAARTGADLLLLDTLGELAEAYRLGSVAIVGGGFGGDGGHNLLEPALRGRPVLFGPHHVDMMGECTLLAAAAAGWRCADATQLARILARLLADPDQAWAAGKRAAATIAAARGATVRAIDVAQARLGWEEPSR